MGRVGSIGPAGFPSSPYFPYFPHCLLRLVRIEDNAGREADVSKRSYFFSSLSGALGGVTLATPETSSGLTCAAARFSRRIAS